MYITYLYSSINGPTQEYDFRCKNVCSSSQENSYKAVSVTQN